jgi:hypothetical protein
MHEMPRWVLVTLLIACLVGMIAWARGPEHHRGQYLGSLAEVAAAADHARA